MNDEDLFIFTSIYNAALNKDEAFLHKSWANGIIDKGIVYINGLAHTPGAMLARDGKCDACELLINYGANKAAIASGAVLVGHLDYAKYVIGRFGEDISPYCVAKYAAAGGYKAYANELLENGADINFFARTAGDRECAEHYLRSGASINAVAYGAAQRRDKNYVQDLQRRGASIDVIAAGAALGGDVIFAEELRMRGASIKAIASGAAQTGNVKYIEELRTRGAPMDIIILSTYVAGFIDYAKALNVDYRMQGKDSIEDSLDMRFKLVKLLKSMGVKFVENSLIYSYSLQLAVYTLFVPIFASKNPRIEQENAGRTSNAYKLNHIQWIHIFSFLGFPDNQEQIVNLVSFVLDRVLKLSPMQSACYILGIAYTSNPQYQSMIKVLLELHKYVKQSTNGELKNIANELFNMVLGDYQKLSSGTIDKSTFVADSRKAISDCTHKLRKSMVLAIGFFENTLNTQNRNNLEDIINRLENSIINMTENKLSCLVQ